MLIRRPGAVLPAEEAETLAGAILDRAIERARVTNVEVAIAIGYSESGEKHVREMRAGSKAFTMRHFALATAALPRLARAIAAEMVASIEPDDAATPAARATQEAALAGAELARVGLAATMDGAIDAGERQTLRAQSSRCRRALDTLDASLARAETRAS
jgi:hypothetical protein